MPSLLRTGRHPCLFFEELANRIGSGAMNGLLRQWVREYGGRTGTGADLVRMAEAVAGLLGPFLEEHAVDPRARTADKPIPISAYGQGK